MPARLVRTAARWIRWIVVFLAFFARILGWFNFPRK